jgi:hypothetical protein
MRSHMLKECMGATIGRDFCCKFLCSGCQPNWLANDFQASSPSICTDIFHFVFYFLSATTDLGKYKLRLEVCSVLPNRKWNIGEA